MIFLFFSSSLACLEPELELFEVWEINVRQIIIIANGINSQTPKLQRALREGIQIIKFGHTEALLLKKRTLNGHFSRPAQTDPYIVTMIIWLNMLLVGSQRLEQSNLSILNQS